MTTHANRHISKKDLKNPDALTQELKKGFQWTTNHSKLVIALSSAFIGIGVFYSALQYFAEKAETKAQESFYKIDQAYEKSKEKTPPASSEGDKKETQQQTSADPEILAQQFSGVIQNFPTSRAALLAFLNFAEIKSKDHKSEEILKTAEQLKLGTDLLSALVLIEKGSAEANLKNCKQALETWEHALKLKSAQNVYPEVHLHQALCYESLNETQKAEDTYNKILAEAKDSTTAKSAEKYLRLLKTKIN